MMKRKTRTLQFKKITFKGNFPGSPTVKTLHSQCSGGGGGMGSIPGWETKILHAAQHGQKKK